MESMVDDVISGRALRAGYRVIGVELTEAYHRAAVDWMSAEMEAPGQTALFGAEDT